MSANTGKLIPLNKTVSKNLEFEEQALPHRQQLLALGIQYTRNRDAAEDLVQETFMRAFAAWDSFISGTNCRAWLCRILRNTFINHFRKNKHHRKFVYESGDDAKRALYGDAFFNKKDLHKDMFGDDLGDEVQGSLSSLSEDYRNVVLLADVQGMKYKAVAKTLGVPMGTVMSRLHRARKVLESNLEDFAAKEYGIRKAA